MYELETVPEKDARQFAEQINAEFFYTSAKSDFGIDDLFKSIGNRFLKRNSENYDPSLDDNEQDSNFKLNSKDEKKKSCC